MSPTGYTERLYDGEQPFDEFVLRAARAFGALIEMRDTGLDATIPDTFEPSPYYADRLAETRERLAVVRAMTDEECAAQARSEYGLWEAETAASKEQTDARRERYEAMRSRVLAWLPPTDEHTGLRDFMVEQIDESMRFDCSDYERPEPTRDGAVWRAETLARAERDLAYYEAELTKERQRAAERTEWVRALRASLSQPEPVR